jgi:hypothetical protein
MPRHPSAADFPALVAKLCDAGVEFIIVGGAAAVILGVPITTNDLDIVQSGHINLSTSLGPIDPLCEIGDGEGYDELLAHSELVAGEGRLVRVLDLQKLIAVKTKAGRPKDRLVLPILIATLEERTSTKV